MAVVDRGERADRVDHEQRRVSGAVDRLPDCVDTRGDAGRRLVVHGEHGLEGVRAVLGQFRLDERGIDAAAPVAGNEIDHEAEPFGHRAPQRGEMSGLEHQHAVARRQRIDERRLPGTGAGCRVDDHRARGLEDGLQSIEDFERQACELGAAMVDRRLVHRPQNAVGDIRRSRNLQKMAPGRVRVELEHGASGGELPREVDVSRWAKGIITPVSFSAPAPLPRARERTRAQAPHVRAPRRRG